MKNLIALKQLIIDTLHEKYVEEMAKDLMSSRRFIEDIELENSSWRKTEKLLEYVSHSQKSYAKFLKLIENKGYKELKKNIEQNGSGRENRKIIETPDVVDDFEATLRKYCLHQSSKKNRKLTKSVGFDHHAKGIHYVELTIVRASLPTSDEKEDYVLRSVDRSYTCGRVTLDEVFNTPKDSFVSPRTAILIGGPGMGKTTITQERAHRWSTEGKIESQHGYLTKFLFRFECREYKDKTVSLMGLLFSAFGNYDDTQKKEILSAINNPFTEIIFDGLDEIEGKTTACNDVGDPYEKISISEMVYNIREGNLLKNVRFLGTSRPCRDVKREDYHTTAVAWGFSRASIGKCMKAICDIDDETNRKEKGEEKDKIYESIMSHIEESKLYVHCFVPLTCVLLGVTLKKELENDSLNYPRGLSDRLTDLYIKMTKLFMREDTDKEKNSLRRLCKLAAYGMIEKDRKIIFNDNDLTHCGITEEDKDKGILDYTTNQERTKKNVASFLHLSYQEFLTAVDVVLNWKEKDIKDIIRQMPKGKYDVVIFFVAGLLSNKDGTRYFLQGLQTSLKDNDIKTRAQVMLSWMKQVQNEYKNRSRKICQLKIMMCLYEGHMEEETREMGWGRTLDLSYIPLLPHQLVSTTYYMERKGGTAELNVLK